MLRGATHRLTRRTVFVVAGLVISMLGAVLSGLVWPSPAPAQPATIDITVVTTELPPFVIDDDGDADGFYFEIWQEAASEAGIRFDLVWADSFSEMLDIVEAGQADVAVAPLAPTAEREERLDFTSAVISSGPQVGLHERDRKNARSLLQAIFSWSVIRILAYAVLGLVLLAHVVWLVERSDDEGIGDISNGYVRGVWDSFWWAAVTITTVGYGDTVPRSTRGRVIALLAMVASLFLVGALVSQTTTVLGEEVEQNPVQGVGDMAGVRVAALQGSSFASFLANNDANVVEFADNDAMFAAVADGQVDALVTNPFTLRSLGPEHDIAPVGDVLFEEFETFGLQQVQTCESHSTR